MKPLSTSSCAEARATDAVDDIRPPQPTTAPPGADLPCVASETLLQGGKVVLIRHNGAVYQLRATRAGKLILTK